MLWSTTTILLLVSTVFCTSAAQIFQKRAALALAHTPAPEYSPIISKDIIFSIALLGGGLLLWLLFLTRVDVSIAYPLLSINYVIVLLCAKWLFHETIPSHRWVGAFAIMAGIWLLVGEAR